MGTDGYKRGADVEYRPGEVILEIGSGESTFFLAGLGPQVHTIDPASPLNPVGQASTVLQYNGYAESVLSTWQFPIGFAWLDGWDFPYDGVDYTDQRAQYEGRGQTYSQEASRQSHFTICQRIARHARVIAFDDTWRTHEFHTWTGRCSAHVPPATMPAPALAMDSSLDRDTCELPPEHPHHNSPERGWDGKGGEGIPYLLENGFRVLEYGLGLVVLERGND